MIPKPRECRGFFFVFGRRAAENAGATGSGTGKPAA
jgi:hypothetical protein